MASSLVSALPVKRRLKNTAVNGSCLNLGETDYSQMTNQQFGFVEEARHSCHDNEIVNIYTDYET